MFFKYRYELFFAIICLPTVFITNQYIMPGAPGHMQEYFIALPSSYGFRIIWTLIYLGIGAGFGHMCRNASKYTVNIWLFATQFVLNLLWSPLIFSLKRIDLAFINLSVIWALVFTLVLRTYKDKRLIWLFTPYLIALTHAWFLALSLIFVGSQLELTEFTIVI